VPKRFAFPLWARHCRRPRRCAVRGSFKALLIAVTLACPSVLQAQAAPTTRPSPVDRPADAAAPNVPTVTLTPAMSELKGKPVREVLIRGNETVHTGVIRNLISTRVGQPFDPSTVSEDYQRIFAQHKFANVEAKVEPIGDGVSVVFVVTEQRQIKLIKFRGSVNIDEIALRQVIALKEGDAIDSFRISDARTEIERFYKDKNYALAHVTVDEDALSRDGVLVFVIVEGPNVRIRNIRFVGAEHFKDKLNSQIKSATYLILFNSGKYEPNVVEEDVAAIRRFYESKGFFDVRVGRKLIWSPDQTELQIDFVIEEGPRYQIDKVTFQRVNGDAVTGASTLGVPEKELRSNMKALEGAYYDADVLARDSREIVRVYSAHYGYIYYPSSNDPDYLRVEPRPVFRKEAGKLELIYMVREGKEFYLGNIFTRGNTKSQYPLVLRNFQDFTPGEKFNSSALQDATERLRRSPYFSNATVTPIGDDPNVRDLLVEVTEQKTASFNIGAGVNSNGGVGGTLVYEQRNFDIGNWPASLGDLFTERSFTGRGQDLKIAFEPGTIQTNAYLRFSEPYLFDLPYSFTNEAYLRSREREHYDERRYGDTVTFGHRFTYNLLGTVGFRAENVKIHNIEDPKIRAPEIIEGEGQHGLTSISFGLRHDTTNPGLVVSQGTVTTLRWESYGLMGGEYDFNKFTLGFEAYKTVGEDLQERKTVVAFRGNTGYIGGSAPFFERFYGGGIGSIRGFKFRGVSPRSGLDEDPIGGEFIATGTVELNFPLIGDNLRGVVFTDFGTVEPDLRLSTLRVSVGAGIRFILPFLGQIPIAIDFAVPVMKDDQDDKQLISFSFGFSQ
jgi:outer membrane protein assembly factor BamA